MMWRRKQKRESPDEQARTVEQTRTTVLLVDRTALDSSDTIALEEVIDTVMEEADRIVLDLTTVSDLSSAVVALFILEADKACKAGGSLELAGLRGRPVEMLRMCGAEERFRTHETVADALKEARSFERLASDRDGKDQRSRNLAQMSARMLLCA